MAGYPCIRCGVGGDVLGMSSLSPHHHKSDEQETVMNATGKRRLLKLADFLETAELPGKFNLQTLSDEQKGGRPACGTQACALGWATTIPAFRDAGLHFNRFGLLRLAGHRSALRFNWREVAAAFFKIPENDAADVFGCDGGPTDLGMRGRRKVIGRIRKLVASKAA